MILMAMVIISSYNIIFDFHKNLHQDQLLDCKLGRGRQLNEKEQIKLQVGDCDGIDHEATMMSKC